MPTPFTDYKLAQFRSWFPHTSKQLAYLNHAAISPLSVRVVEAMESYIDGRHIGDIETFEDDMEAMEDTRVLLARLMNAPSAERIAFQANTSAGLHVVADNFPWEDGDEIIINSMEFPTNVYPFLNQKKKGVKVTEINADDGEIPVEKIEAAITEKTRMVTISAVQFLSGYRADLKAIGELCKQKNITFVVDAIQALGAVPVDVQSMHIDALSGGSHKWLMAPVGLGFLYVSEELQEKMKEHYYGWLSVEEPWDLLNRNQQLAKTANRFESGAANFVAIHGLHASLTTLLEIGINDIHQHVLYLTDLLIDGIWDFPVQAFSTKDRNHRAGIFTISLPENADTDLIEHNLKKEAITVSMREGKLRVAPHFYNNSHEMMHLTNVLRYVLGSSKK